MACDSAVPSCPVISCGSRCELLALKRRRFGKIRAEATVEGELVCSGELMFSLVD